MWDHHHLLEITRGAIAKEEQRLRLEQSPHGLDSWPELAFHPLLAAALRESGFGVFPEVPYPPTAAQMVKPALLRRDRSRCDLVLTPDPALPPLDPVLEGRRLREAQTTLFADQARAEPSRGTPSDEALWLEIKVSGQFAYVDGVPRANRAYAGELLTTAAADIPKLSGNPSIRHAALLIILFTEEQGTAEHDLVVFARRAAERGLAIRALLLEGVRIVDRVGNGWCQLAWVGADPQGVGD
jgi:hypothetical protein